MQNTRPGPILSLFYVMPAKAGIHISVIGFRLKNCRNDVQGCTNTVVAWMLPALRHAVTSGGKIEVVGD
jgi:hypothetical protein